MQVKLSFWLRLFLGSFCLTTLLSCGGTANDSPPPTTITPFPAVGPNTGAVKLFILPPPPSVTAPSPTNDLATDGLAWLNYRRGLIGLPPYTRNSQLDQAALAHAKYLALHNTSDIHTEVVGNPEFTGINPSNRIATAGYTTTRSGENIAYDSSLNPARDFTDSLIAAPYHRQTQFDFYKDAGTGVTRSTQSHYVINFGDLNNWLPANEIMAYPAPGQTNVHLDWVVNEVPNPLPDKSMQRVGYPVSLHAGPNDTLQVDSVTLIDTKRNAVNGQLVTTRTDNNQPLRNYAFWIPLQALAPNTQYMATATGRLNTLPFTLTWSFTTLTVQPLTITPSTATLLPGSSTFTVTGGTQQYTLSAGSKYSFVPPPPPTPTFLSPPAAASNVSGLLTITRTAETCSTPYMNCFIVITATDSAGTTLALDLPF